MKKLILVIAVLLASSCEEVSSDTKSKWIQDDCVLIDISFEGHTHEFVYMSRGYEGSIEHWPDCKYCNPQNSVKTNE